MSQAGYRSLDPERVTGIVTKGYGSASGVRLFSEVGGAIRAQRAHFESLGMNLDEFINGTVNVDISPFEFVPVESAYTFMNVKWHQDFPAENFSFFGILCRHKNREYSAYVYLPHPETKAGFSEKFNPMSKVEFIAPKIEGLNYGDDIEIASPVGDIRFRIYSNSKSEFPYSAVGSLRFHENTGR